MEKRKKEVRDELIHSLYEWGVNRSDGDHSRFRQTVVQSCVSSLTERANGPISDYRTLKNEKFPKKYNDAYEHVLRHDEVSDKPHTYSDKIGREGVYPDPYYRMRDRRTGNSYTPGFKYGTPGFKYGYKLKNEYKEFTSNQLDPLHRFEFDVITKEELFFERWFVDDDKASSDGVLMEAVLACHALASEACYNCKFRKVLRWNGGGSTSWQDMVCTNCGAMYEVKTKANVEKIEKALHFNNIQGGSFSTWCQLMNTKQPNQKMYLVLLPRRPTFNRKKEKGKLFLEINYYREKVAPSCTSQAQLSFLSPVFPVTIAEINSVLPKLYPGTFNPNNKSIRFKSTISHKLNTKAKWFDLPVTGETIDMDAIAVRVFKERFSEETYCSLKEKYFGSDSSDDARGNKKYEVPEVAESDLQSTIKALQEVEVDDWEDLASDSD